VDNGAVVARERASRQIVLADDRFAGLAAARDGGVWLPGIDALYGRCGLQPNGARRGALAFGRLEKRVGRDGRTEKEILPLAAPSVGFSDSTPAALLRSFKHALDRFDCYACAATFREIDEREWRRRRLVALWDELRPDASPEERDAAIEAGLGPHGFPLPLWSGENVEYMHWLGVDLDVDRENATGGRAAWDALRDTSLMVERGELPPYSFAVFSGRGLWLCYLLVDERNPAEGTGRVHSADGAAWRIHGPDSALWIDSADNRDRYQMTYAALAAKLAPFNPDPVCKNLSRLGPLIGSNRSTVGRRVEAMVPAWSGASWSRLLAHTLEQLWVGCGQPAGAMRSAYVPARRARAERPAALTTRHYADVTPVDPEAFALTAPAQRVAQRWANRSRRHGKAGATAHALHDWRRWEMLLAGRGGGFDEGCRANGLLYFGSAMRAAGESRAYVTQRLREVAAAGRDPLSERETNKHIRSVFAVWDKDRRGKRPPKANLPSHATIRADVHMTDAEWEAWTRNGCPRPAPAPPKRSQAITEQRLALIREAVTAAPVVPTVRELSALCREHGHAGGRRTILGDVSQLGLTLRTGRPPALSVV